MLTMAKNVIISIEPHSGSISFPPEILNEKKKIVDNNGLYVNLLCVCVCFFFSPNKFESGLPTIP